MSIRINREKCIGCEKCTVVCPGTLIGMEDSQQPRSKLWGIKRDAQQSCGVLTQNRNKAVMQYPRDCWGCVSCVKECPVGAIEFFLGADIGGNGSTMNVDLDGDILHWNIKRQDGTITTIDVDRRNANQY